MRILFLASAVALLGVYSSPVFGQLAQGELRGAIVDESGGVLPGVTVTATHVETGTSRTTATAANGTYLMPAMPLGTYKVTAELSGFSTTIREGFRLGVGEAVTINLTLKVASLAGIDHRQRRVADHRHEKVRADRSRRSGAGRSRCR